MVRLVALIMVFILFTPTLFANYNIETPLTINKAEALEPVTTRFACHEDTDYQNGTHQATFGLPCWVKGSPYTKFILTSYTDRVEIQNGLFGGQLNTTNSEMRIYDLYFHDIKSYENWIVEYKDGNDWIDTNINSVIPTITTLQNDTGIYVTSIRENSDIKLTINYITEESKPLQHYVILENLQSEREYRILQEQKVINADNISYGGNVINVGSSFTVDEREIYFEHSNGTLILKETQLSEYYRNVTITPTPNIVTGSFLFANKNNQTSLTLSQNGIFSMDSGATCTASGGDTSCTKTEWGQMISTAHTSAGDDCGVGTTWSSNYQDTSASVAPNAGIGEDDNKRCLLFFWSFDITNLPNSPTVTNVIFTWASGSVDGYSCSSISEGGAGNCADMNVDLHFVDDGCNDDNSEYDDAFGESILSGTTLATNIDPDIWDDGETETYTASSLKTYVSGKTTSAGNGNQEELCFGISQTGTDTAGCAGGDCAHNFWKIYPPVVTITYSTDIVMSFDVNNYEGVLLEKGNILLRATEGSNAGVAASTYTACSNECTFSATPSTTYTFAVQWNAANTGAGHLLNYVKVDIGATTFNSTHTHSCASNCDVELNTQIYQNTDIEFRDYNGQLHSPVSVTALHTENSTELTRTDFASKGVMNFPLLGVGNSSSFRIKDVNLYGNNVVTNASATITPTAKDQNIQHNNRVYFINFKGVANGDTLMDLEIERLDFRFSCATVCSNTTEKQITDLTLVQVTNMTIDLMSMRYQDWSLNQNSTNFSIGKMNHNSDVVSLATNNTILLTGNYFKMFYQAQADSTNLPVSVNLKSTLANGTVIDIATTATGINEKPIYMANSSQTLNIMWKSLNVSKTTQAPSASATVNVATQLKFPTDTEFVVGRNNTEFSEFSWASSNSTFRVNATVNLADADTDQTLKIEIVDRQYATEPLTRFLNTTEGSGWTFADPIISDSFTMSGVTMIKYKLNPDSGLVGQGAGNPGGGGGSPSSPPSIQRGADIVQGIMPDIIEDAIPEEFEASEYILIVSVFLGIGFITLGNGFGSKKSNRKRGRLASGSKSKRGVTRA